MMWMVDGQVLGSVAGAGLKEAWEALRFQDCQSISTKWLARSSSPTGKRGNSTPPRPTSALKIRTLDGVQAEVIYGILGLGGGFPVGGNDYGITDADRTVLMYDIYNEWLAGFCSSNPDRFAGLACLTSHDPKVAADQLRKAAEMGLRGAELNVSQAVKPIYHEAWDPLWAVAEECQIPVSFHTLGIPYRKPDPEDRKRLEWVDFGLTLVMFQLVRGRVSGQYDVRRRM